MLISEYKKLKNGAQVIIVQNKNLKTISASVNFNVGVKNENDKNTGISHFIEHLICQNKDLNRELDLWGVRVYGTTYRERTEYFLRILKEDFVSVFENFIKCFSSFNIKENEIKKEKKIIKEEILDCWNDNSWKAEEFLENLMYPDSYMGRNILGSVNSLTGLTKEKIENFYKEYYTPTNLVICLVGDVTPAIKKNLIKIVESWNNKFRLYNSFSGRENFENLNKLESHITIEKFKTRQTDGVIGFKGFNIFDKRKYILELLTIILTNGYNSRLFKEIREKRGLVYYLSSFCVEYIESGYLGIKFRCADKNLQKILEVIGKEIKELSNKLITDEELFRAKKNLKYQQINLVLENPAELSEELAARKILVGKNIDIEEELFPLIDEIKKEDILRIASEVFNKKNIYISLVGNVLSKKEVYLKYFS